MTAYIIGQLRVTNWDWYREYRRVTEALVAEHGGHYLVKGGETDWLEGEGGAPDAVVVIAFPDRAAAHNWYRDPRYAGMIELRRNSGVHTQLMLSDGLAPGA